jgi:fermentation-respiration switch protein FrsA (DUF1100 family)
LPILPFDKFNNLRKIKKVKCPVLVIHGQLDDTVPFAHGQKLFAAVTSRKLFLGVKEANHNDLARVAGTRYEAILQDFRALVEKNQQLR